MKPTFLLPILLLMIATRAFAQTAERPPAPVRIGPLDVYPTLALTNFGVDNNVFNEPDQAEPKRDFTMTVTPAADLRMRLGRARADRRRQGGPRVLPDATRASGRSTATSRAACRSR